VVLLEEWCFASWWRLEAELDTGDLNSLYSDVKEILPSPIFSWDPQSLLPCTVPL